MVTMKGSFESKDQTTNQRTTSSQVTEDKQYTIGTTLPEGNSIQEKLNKWAADDEKIMSHPMPIGGIQLIPITDAIIQSRESRQGLTSTESQKVMALSNHLGEDKYC